MAHRGRHIAPSIRRISRTWVIPLTLVMSLVLSGVAWGDELLVDGDEVVPVSANPMNLGNICIGQQATKTALLAIRRTQGGANAYADSTAVSVGAGIASDPNVTPSSLDASINLPSNWISSGTISGDTSSWAISAIAVGSPGARSATLTFTATGSNNANENTLVRQAVLTVNWSVSICDSTPPVITPNVTGSLGDNDWYTSDVTVSWTVTDAESTVTSNAGCDTASITADTAGTTLTCTATSAGGTASDSITIKRDATAPTVTGLAVPPANFAGWNNSDVTVSFTCDDLMSGIASCGLDQTLSADGEDQSVTGSAVDMAGNTATTTVGGIDIDKTAPTISGSRIPLANTFGWANTNIIVSFVCGDSGSGVASCTAPQTLTAEGADQSVTGIVTDLAGNSTSITVSAINIDKTNPTISGAASPAPNENGWNKTNVDVSYTCGDALSGIASCGPDETLTTEDATLSSTGTAVDKAGNSASTTVTGIKIDKTAPSIVGSRTPAANSNGWNNEAVTVSFTCADALSGIEFCTPGTTLTGEGANQSVLGVATDVAGNSNSATVSGVKIDLTAPTITGSAAPAPNGAGWNNSPVTVSFNCEDLLSGIASCGPNQTLLADGMSQSVTGTAVDNADNSSSVIVSGINLDQTAPEVSVTGVGDGDTYILGSVPTAGCSTTDSLSEVKSPAAITITGGTAGGVGTFQATCSGAIDVADNFAGDVVATYYVIYDFNGFFRPVDDAPMVNTVKAGSAIPVKFSLSGDQGLNILASGFPKSSVMACNLSLFTDPIDSTVTAGWSSLSYDTDSGQYVYVWKTDKAWAGSCRQLVVKLVDGTEHFAYFKFNR